MAMALLYNVKTAQKMTQIRAILARLGIECLDVLPADYQKLIGELVGYACSIPVETGDEKEPFTEEMMVLYDLDGLQFQALLDQMRDDHCRIGLKAVVTEHNVRWTSTQLYRELVREREAVEREIANSVIPKEPVSEISQEQVLRRAQEKKKVPEKQPPQRVR